MASRDLADLEPETRARARHLLDLARAAGIDLLVTCTYRSPSEQAELYRQGRGGVSGRRVTNARAGDSWHNWRRALDVVPLRAGKPVWGTTGADGLLWQRVGKLGEQAGLEWAGRWRSFPEFAHFQHAGGLTLARLKAEAGLA